MKDRPLLPLFWVMLLDTASYTVRFPVLTLVFFDDSTRLFMTGTAMPVRSWWYGVCMAIYWVGQMIAAPLLSLWSDYVGRKKVLVFGGIGTFLFALFTVAGVLWGSVSFIIVGSFIGGICSRMDPIAQAAVGDVSVTENKILLMSYLQLFISIGAIIGPLIGGYLAQRFFFPQLNFSLPFMLAALLAVIGILILLRYFRETASLDMTVTLSKYINFKAVITNKKVLTISIMLILIQWSWSTYYQFIAPILKKAFAFTGPEIGLFMGFVGVCLALAAGLGVKILQRFFSIEKIIFFATYAIFIGLLGSLLITFLYQINWLRFLNWIFVIPIAAGDVIAYSAITALYSGAVAKTAQGQVMGTNFIIIAVVWGATSLLGGLLLGINSMLPLIFSIIGVAILLILFNLKKDLFYENSDVRSRTA